MKATTPWLILLALASPTLADDKPTDFEAHTFTERGGAKMPYRLLEPAKIEGGKKYPLVLILHGWGERGSDNKKQLEDFAAAVTKPDIRKRFPCFVVIPQAEGSWVQHPVFDKPIRLTKAPVPSLLLANDIVKSHVHHRPQRTARRRKKSPPRTELPALDVRPAQRPARGPLRENRQAQG